jgi:hypothetical protein
MNLAAFVHPYGRAKSGKAHPHGGSTAATSQTSTGKSPALALSQQLQAQDAARLAVELGKKFRKNGIGTTQPVIIAVSADSGLHVANEHVQSREIELLLVNHSELRTRFEQLAANASLLRAAEHYDVYAQEYARLENNPAARCALVEAEIARNNAQVEIAITGDEIEIRFAEPRSNSNA